MGDNIVTVRGATSEIQDKGSLHTNHLPLSHVHMKCFSAVLKITDESERLALQCRGRVHAACSECEILLVMISPVQVLVTPGLPHMPTVS